MTRVALFDVGTNSIKFMIVEVTGKRRRTLHFSTHVTRIGRGIRDDGRISGAALQATLRAIRDCRRTARHHHVEHTFAFATYALRQARNAEAARQAIERASATTLHIISGRQEAQFAYASARESLELHRPHTLMLDIGGGSTEVVLATRGRITRARSLPLGALHLTERFIKTDPILTPAFVKLETHVASLAKKHLRAMGVHRLRPASIDLVASGGSVSTTARVIAAAKRQPDATVTLGDVNRFIGRCLTTSLSERKRIRGLEPERADIIPAGLAVIRCFMRESRKRVMTHNAAGVRAGVLVSLIENDLVWPF